ncbi:MAG: PHP domain-containing protein [Candidatus Diapherotrites archaeon]|nr:PHP domain-containing protein [Candidatus Diapherotrites archaeon]
MPALTEHNSTRPWIEAISLSKKYSVPFIKGEEIKVYNNGSLVGELLGLFMTSHVNPGEIFEVIDKLKDQDAIISVSHPFDLLRRPFFQGFRMLEEIKKEVHAIEVFNSRCLLGSANEKAKAFAERNKLAFTAGTDAHFKCELGNAYLCVDADTLETARKKILKGQCTYFGRKGPLRAQIYTKLAKLHLM